MVGKINNVLQHRRFAKVAGFAPGVRMRSSYIYVLVASILAGCGGGPGAQACGAPQTLMVVGYSTGSAPANFPLPIASSPYPAAATFLYFSAANGPPQTNAANPPTFTGTPVLTGSNGSTIAGGTLLPIENTHLSITDLYGYSSSISGLIPNVTYSVSFSSLQWSQTGCNYGGQTAGSFSTN